MATRHSFAEFVKSKCFDGLYEAAENYASDNIESLDLRTRNVSCNGDIKFVDAKTVIVDPMNFLLQMET